EIIESKNTDLTAFIIIDEMLPSLKKIDFNELKKFKEDNKDNLNNFRNKMNSVAEEIQTNYWDRDFKNKVKDKLRYEIKDQIDELKKDLKTGYFERLNVTAHQGYISNPIIGQIQFEHLRRLRIKNSLSYLLDIEK